MGRSKATVTLDREKVARAQVLTGADSMSVVIDTALDRLIRAEELRRDVAVYAATPLTSDELDVTDLPVELDLADEGVDYDFWYGESK